METIIRPRESWWKLDLTEMWGYRDLFYFLAWRDIKVKYKQTIIGAAWAIFQPLVSTIVFTIFFGRLGKMPSDGVPYPIFVFTGLIFWQLFSGSLSSVSNSFVGNEGIITKIYFPRLILPVSAIFTSMVDFGVALVVLVGMMVYYGAVPSPYVFLAVPVLVSLTALSALGIGLLFASLNVKYRDVRYALPFIMQTLIFVTPVIYPVSIVAAKWRWVFGLNPMSGIISLSRVVFLGSGAVDWPLVGSSLFFLVAFVVVGYAYFKHVERYFADVI